MNQVNKLGKISSVSWVVFVFISYLVFHPGTSTALFTIPYIGPVLILVLGILATYYGVGKSGNNINWKGIYWPVSILLVSAIFILTFYSVTGIDADGILSGIGFFWLFSVGLMLTTFLIYSSAWSCGLLLKGVVKLDFLKDTHLIAIGLSILTLTGTLLGLLGLFNQYSIATICLLPIILNFKPWKSWVLGVLWKSRLVHVSSFWHVATFYCLIAVLSIAWISGIKAFPYGNDGASLYLALAHRLNEAGSLPTGGQSYSWSVFMAFGEALTNSATVSILLSNTMGFVSMIALFQLMKRWFSDFWSLFSVLLIFASPFFGFHSIIDEKIDLALLFFTIVIVQLSLVYREQNFEIEDKDSSKGTSYKLLLILGWLCGFSFSIKYSFVIVLVSILPLLLFKTRKAQLGGFILLLGALFAIGAERFGGIQLPSIEKTSLVVFFALLGATLLIKGEQNLGSYKKVFLNTIVFGLVASASFSPWAFKHSAENGHLGLKSALEGVEEKPILLTEPFIGFNFITNPDQINQNPHWIDNYSARFMQSSSINATSETTNSIYEELQRYLGFEKGFWRLASLPTDITFSVNIFGNRYVQIGFLLLALIPFFFFRARRSLLNFLVTVGGLILFCFALYSINQFDDVTKVSNKIMLLDGLHQEHPLGFQSLSRFMIEIVLQGLYSVGFFLSPVYDLLSTIGQGYSMVIITSIVVTLSLYNRQILSKWSNSAIDLMIFIVTSGLSWWLLGMGVVWYGIAFFTLAPFAFIYTASHRKLQKGILSDPFINKIFKSVLGLQALVFVLTYLTNPRVGGPPNYLFNPSELEYTMSPTVEKNALLQKNSFIYPEIISKLNEDNNAKIYLVNTRLGYHINNFDRRVFRDDLLQSYKGVIAKHGESISFSDILKSNKFKYVLFDMYVPTLDKTPQQNLVKRSKLFLTELLENPNAELIMTDNFIYDENASVVKLPSGQTTNARQHIWGQTVYNGSVVLFEIK